jgi:hypothetical protein
LGENFRSTWNLSGGGSSAYEPSQSSPALPAFQSPIASTLQTLNNSTTVTTPFFGSEVGVGISTTQRAVPDVSVNGNPYTGYWVWDSFQFELLGYVPTCPTANPTCTPGSPDVSGWLIVGGSSAASNIVAGFVNSSGTFRASSTAELTYMYSHYPSQSWYDVGTIYGNGMCGPYQGYEAGPGWDPCTGLGEPLGPYWFIPGPGAF